MITVKNTAPIGNGQVRLEEEAKRQSEIEKLRAKRIRQEQEYIDQMSLSVENHLRAQRRNSSTTSSLRSASARKCTGCTGSARTSCRA